MNPPSTADATITGGALASEAGAGDEEHQHGAISSSSHHMHRQQSSNEAVDAAANEELLLNKSEFLLNELTGGMMGCGESQSPLTSADLMAIMMMTMSAADQISLNGVSSSLATTALPTVLTPLYTTDNEQYVVRRRRRRQRSKAAGGSEGNQAATGASTLDEANNKKYIRIRRKAGGASRKKANKSTTTTTPTASLEPSTTTLDTQPQQEQIDNNPSQTTEGAVDNNTGAQLESKAAANKQAKPKHRKRKRILNLVAANEIISTNNQMTQTSDQHQQQEGIVCLINIETISLIRKNKSINLLHIIK